MIILRDPSSASGIANPTVHALVQRRFAEICADEPYREDRHGYMIVVEPGDRTDELEAESNCAILQNVFDDARLGDPDFFPCCEVLEEHPGCYEMVFLLNDDGFAIDIFIPKEEGIDPDLLAMCAAYAVPAA